MTTAPEFTHNVVGTLQYLDTMLPKGSHVVMLGLMCVELLQSTFFIECSTFRSYGVDAHGTHACGVLRDASSRDGRMMWDTMHDLQYPLLDLNYQELWGILDLFHANPCPSEILQQNTFFGSNALQCTATARILIPAECSAVP